MSLNTYNSNIDLNAKQKVWKADVKFWLAMEVPVLILTIIVVWALFLVPVVFYFGRLANSKVPTQIAMYSFNVCTLVIKE